MQDHLDISREMAILYRLAAQGEEPAPRRSPLVTWLSIGALAVALGWGGTAFAARSGYTVSPGETLYQIAGRHFGSGPRWVEIAALNKIVDPARLRAGQVITLPDPHEHIAVVDTGARSARQERRQRIARAGGDETARASRKHRVATGMRRPRSQADRHAVVGQTRDGIRIVPPGEVVLELPARHPDARTAASRASAEEIAPLPAPMFPLHDSPWRAVDGAAFLLGALGVTGLLGRGRSLAGRPSLARAT